MYRIALLAYILAAAALCSGVDVAPRSNIKYDPPGSHLKAAANPSSAHILARGYMGGGEGSGSSYHRVGADKRRRHGQVPAPGTPGTGDVYGPSLHKQRRGMLSGRSPQQSEGRSSNSHPGSSSSGGRPPSRRSPQQSEGRSSNSHPGSSSSGGRPPSRRSPLQSNVRSSNSHPVSSSSGGRPHSRRSPQQSEGRSSDSHPGSSSSGGRPPSRRSPQMTNGRSSNSHPGSSSSGGRPH